MIEPRKHGWRRGAQWRAGDGKRVIWTANLIPEIFIGQCFLGSGWSQSERSLAKLRKPERRCRLVSENSGWVAAQNASVQMMFHKLDNVSVRFTCDSPSVTLGICLCCWHTVDESRCCSSFCAGAVKCIQLLLCSGPLLSGHVKKENRHTSLTSSLS